MKCFVGLIIHLTIFWVSTVSEAQEAAITWKETDDRFRSFVVGVELGEPYKVLLCPIVLGGDNDPFSDDRRLSFHGYGEIIGDKVPKFLEFLNDEKSTVAFPEPGVQFRMVFLMKKLPTQPAQTALCRIVGEDILVNLKIGEQSIAYKLSPRAAKLILDHLVRSKR
jgi:hypothetical protein